MIDIDTLLLEIDADYEEVQIDPAAAGGLIAAMAFVAAFWLMVAVVAAGVLS